MPYDFGAAVALPKSGPNRRATFAVRTSSALGRSASRAKQTGDKEGTSRGKTGGAGWKGQGHGKSAGALSDTPRWEIVLRARVTGSDGELADLRTVRNLYFPPWVRWNCLGYLAAGSLDELVRTWPEKTSPTSELKRG